VIAANPQGPLETPAATEEVKKEFLDGISHLLRSQGVTRPNASELNDVLTIHTWPDSCYDFAHFTDEELADGIIAAHETIDGWTRDELVATLGQCRMERMNANNIWQKLFLDAPFARDITWASKFGSAVLAEALWPALERKIERLLADPEAPIPPIVQVVRDAYQRAEHRRQIPFTLTEEPPPIGGA
jgi:hypothetical protein